MKQKRFKAKAILVFLCSVGLFLTTLCAFRSPLTFLLLDKVVIPFVEQSVEGINAGIGRIEITSFSRVDLHDLSLKYHPSGQAGYDFTIPQVRLSFDPTDLFRGVDNFLQTFKLEAGAGECIVNMPPGPSVDKNTSTSGFSSLPWLPEVVPTIELQNWRVVVRSKREEWSLSDIDIQGGKQLSKPLHLKGKALFKQVIVQLAARVEPSDALLTLKAENDPASTFIFRSEATFSFDPAQPVDGTGKFNLEYGNGRIFDHRVDHLSLSGMVGKRKLRLDNASLEGKNEQLSVQRFVLPLDLLFSGEIAGAIAKGEGELTLSLSEPAAYIPYIPPEYHNAYLNSRLEKLNLIVKLRDGSLVIDTARLSGADFEIQLTDGVLKPSGGTTSWDAVEINLPWLIEIGEMAAISTLLDKKVSLAGGLSAQGTLTGTFAEPSFTYSLSATALRYGSLPIGNVEARGKGDSHGITLDTLQIISEAGRLEGSGGYDFASRCFLPTVIDCNLTNLKPYGEFVGQELDGDIRLRLRLDGALTAPRGTAFIDVDHLAYGTTSLRDMHLESSLAGDLIAVKQLRLRYNDNLSVETSGRLNRKPTGALLTLEHLTINHPVTKAELVKEATLFFSGDTLQIEDTLRMVTDVGYVELGGRLGKEDGDFAISGSFCGDRDLIREICGIGEADFRAASFNLSVQGPWVAPVWKLDASMHELNYREFKGLSAQVHLNYRDQHLAIGELTLIHKEKSLIEADGFLPLETSSSRVSLLDGPLRLNGVMDLGDPRLFAFLFPELIKKSGPIHLDFAVHGTTSHPLGGVNLSVEHFQLDPALSHLPDEPFSIKAQISGEKSSLALKKFAVSSPTISGTASGLISKMNSAEIKNWREFFDNSVVTLEGELRMADLSWLSREVAVIEKLKGAADLRFKISGPLSNPAYSGEAAVKNGTLRIGSDLPAIREINMNATVSEQGITFTQCFALLGGAPVECGGNIGLAPERVGELDLTLKGNDMLLYRDEGISFRGNGDLRFAGNMEALDISGAIRLTEGKIQTVIDFLSLFTSLFDTGPRPEPRVFSIRTDPLRNGKLHIKLTSEQPVIVANNLLNARLQPDLLLTGTGELPYLVGELTLQQGRLLLPGGRLNIEEGRVIFDELNPDRPMVQISGQTKMKGYDISALIDGYYDEPTVNLSSTPYLAEKDVLLLLLTGRKPQKSTGTGVSETEWGDMAFFVSKNLYKSFVNGDEPEQEYLAERFTLDIGRETTKQGDNTIEARFFINDGFWLPNDQLFMVAEKDVWDDYHLGLRLVFRYF